MPLTREQIEANIASLNEAIASGVRSATVGGQTLTFNTTASLIAARDDFQNQLNGLVRPARRRFLGVYTGRGYD